MTGKLQVTLAFWWSLLGIWLLANQLRAQQPPARLAQPREAIGFGSDAEKAKEDALKQAARQLGTLVEQRYPSLANWQPSLKYVEENCVEKTVLNEEELLPNNPNVKGIKLTLILKA